jgi:hypothetical protein
VGEPHTGHAGTVTDGAHYCLGVESIVTNDVHGLEPLALESCDAGKLIGDVSGGVGGTSEEVRIEDGEAHNIHGEVPKLAKAGGTRLWSDQEFRQTRVSAQRTLTPNNLNRGNGRDGEALGPVGKLTPLLEQRDIPVQQGPIPVVTLVAHVELPTVCPTLRISCEAVPPSILPAGAQGGTSARSTGAALSFVSCIRLLGGPDRPSHDLLCRPG